MRVLLEKVVLDDPDAVDAEPVGKLDLLELLFQEPVLVIGRPGSRQVVLDEDSAWLEVTIPVESDLAGYHRPSSEFLRGQPGSDFDPIQLNIEEKKS